MFPIQISPFESDNKIDAHIQGIILEGGGGGGNHESYELLAYHAANYIHMDALELRGQKGLLFFIGDERMYDRVDAREVERVFGVNLEDLELESLDTKDVFADLKEKFEVFFIMSEHTATKADQWTQGGRALRLLRTARSRGATWSTRRTSSCSRTPRTSARRSPASSRRGARISSRSNFQSRFGTGDQKISRWNSGDLSTSAAVLETVQGRDAKTFKAVRPGWRQWGMGQPSTSFN
jgi:hypothetical protein